MDDSIWSHYHHTKRSLRMRRITWPITGAGAQTLSIFWNPGPQFVYSLCQFQGATTKIKPCYRPKIAFSHCEVYYVYCACAVSRDLCTGVPKTTRNNFWPRIHYTTFMGLRRWLKVVYIGDPHVKAVLARKKTVRSKSVPKMSVFRKFKGLNIKYSYRDPKRHFLTRNDVLWRILRKYPLRDVGCSLIEEPKTTNVITSHIKRHGKMTYLGSRNPWTDLYKILHLGCRS